MGSVENQAAAATQNEHLVSRCPRTFTSRDPLLSFAFLFSIGEANDQEDLFAMAVPLNEGGVGDGASEKRTVKYYKVVHKHTVAVHETMSLSSAAVSFKQPGFVVKGLAAGEDQRSAGREEAEGGQQIWVKLSSGEGYMLAKHPTEGQMLEALAPAVFTVTHKAVLIRKDANTSSSVLQIKKQNDIVVVDGHFQGWLKVHNASAGQATSTDGELDPLFADVSAGWVMIQHPTYGKLLQFTKGEIPTFADEKAFEGSLHATPSSVYTGKVTDPLTERLKLELDNIKHAVREKEAETANQRGNSFDLVGKGLMSNANQSSSHSFCIGGEPL